MEMSHGFISNFTRARLGNCDPDHFLALARGKLGTIYRDRCPADLYFTERGDHLTDAEEISIE